MQHGTIGFWCDLDYGRQCEFRGSHHDGSNDGHERESELDHRIAGDAGRRRGLTGARLLAEALARVADYCVKPR